MKREGRSSSGCVAERAVLRSLARSVCLRGPSALALLSSSLLFAASLGGELLSPLPPLLFSHSDRGLQSHGAALRELRARAWTAPALCMSWGSSQPPLPIHCRSTERRGSRHADRRSSAMEGRRHKQRTSWRSVDRGRSSGGHRGADWQPQSATAMDTAHGCTFGSAERAEIRVARCNVR